jgi:hypothetical protein
MLGFVSFNSLLGGPRASLLQQPTDAIPARPAECGQGILQPL